MRTRLRFDTPKASREANPAFSVSLNVLLKDLLNIVLRLALNFYVLPGG
jgi:hypothetical protein